MTITGGTGLTTRFSFASALPEYDLARWLRMVLSEDSLIVGQQYGVPNRVELTDESLFNLTNV